MDNMIKQMYDLVYSSIVTPYNLVENAKLKNYEYVNYTKSGSGLLVSMKCTVDNFGEAIFFYYFDEKDHLLKIIMETSEGQEQIFDRHTEILKLKKQILREREKTLTKKAN